MQVDISLLRIGIGRQVYRGEDPHIVRGRKWWKIAGATPMRPEGSRKNGK